MAAENGKRAKFERDATRVGLGFIPVAHELTGAMGPQARDELFAPALALLKEKKLGEKHETWDLPTMVCQPVTRLI